jgi:hypothetical protein
MNVPDSDLRARIKRSHAQLERFEKQAAIVLACIVTLSVAGYSILLQALR